MFAVADYAAGAVADDADFVGADDDAAAADGYVVVAAVADDFAGVAATMMLDCSTISVLQNCSRRTLA